MNSGNENDETIKKMIAQQLRKQAEITQTEDGLEEWIFKPGYKGKYFDALSSNATIKKITLPNSFKQNIKKLPKSLQTITFGRDYDKTLYNIPQSLKYIYYKEKKPRVEKNRENIIYFDLDNPSFIPEPIILNNNNNNQNMSTHPYPAKVLLIKSNFQRI